MLLNRKIQTLVAGGLLITGCTAILGIHNPKILSTEDIIDAAKIQNIPNSNIYTLKNNFIDFINSKDSVNKINKKDLKQPLQVFYFDKDGDLIFYNVNCYVPGFPNLNWNYMGSMDTFPPRKLISYQYPEKLNSLINYIAPLNNTFNISSEEKYNIVIFWNHFMRKQSIQLIESVKANIKKHHMEDSVNYYFINNDNFYALIDKK